MTSWLHNSIQQLDATAMAQAKKRQALLTKPPGSLGHLEEIAIRLCGMYGRSTILERIHISIFAADHGVGMESVSAYPQVVTQEMIRNFAHGGAAINVLARSLSAHLEVINLGTIRPLEDLDQVISCVIAAGTQNICTAPAMTKPQLSLALDAGNVAARRALQNNQDLFIGGEMGIANTTSATAIACALLNEKPETLVGPGAGLDDRGIAHKTHVIQKALHHHQNNLADPLSILQHLGGFEIAALCGAYIHCAQIGIPILIDGFIASVAALCSHYLCPGILDWCFFAHRSAEPGHAKILQALKVNPILDLRCRLGEGSGAAIAVPILCMSSRLHAEMATFDEASVSSRDAGILGQNI